MNSTDKTSKDLARVRARAFRSQLTDKEYLDTCDRIDDRLLELLEELRPRSVHVYQPLIAQKEVTLYKTGSELVRKKIAMHNQSNKPDFPDAQFDVVVLPALSLDRRGNRVGYGGGAYDGFLATQQHAIRVAVCYDQLVIDSLASEPHDQLVDYIVTESRTLKI